ncbi:MAG: hypothetical protein ACE5K4_10135 [Candidatus Hydrothermarchaeota archaeon]
MIPETIVLLATKLNSITKRDTEYKKIKDLSDIFALLWYSNEDIKKIKQKLFDFYSKERAFEVVKSFTNDDFSRVSEVLEINIREIRRVVLELLSD